MSIQSQLSELERSNENTRTKAIQVIGYFQSAEVTQLIHKIISNLKTSDHRLSESNQNFKLYLYHDKLEMFRYETRVSEVPKFRIPFVSHSTKEIKTVDIEHSPSFVLHFDESLKCKITGFAESLAADELIENLDDLLFSD